MSAILVQKTAEERAEIMKRINAVKAQHQPKPPSAMFMTTVKTEHRRNAETGRMEEVITGGSTRSLHATFGNSIRGADALKKDMRAQKRAA